MTKIIKENENKSYLVTKIIAEKFFTLFSLLPFIKEKSRDKNVEKVIKLYQRNDFTSIFVKIRFWDAPLQQFERIIPSKGKIIDLGCGEGIFTNYLALAKRARNVLGIELNPTRVATANKGLKNAKFIASDVLNVKMPQADAIVMSHMLHHLTSYKLQHKLLKACHKSLNKNGVLCLAEINKSLSLKYLLALFVDTIVVPILFERQLFDKNIFHRSKKAWFNVLEENGFEIIKAVSPKSGPFPDLLIIARKI